MEETLEEGFPTDLEEREAYFMSQISQGEEMSSNGEEATCLSSLKAGVDSMVLQVQTLRTRPFLLAVAGGIAERGRPARRRLQCRSR